MRVTYYFLSFFFTYATINAQNNNQIPLIKRLKSFSKNVSKEEINQEIKTLYKLSNVKQADFYTAIANYQTVMFRDYTSASKNYYLALEFPEITPYNKADALNGVGVIYSKFFQNKLALNNYKKSLAILLKHHSDSVTDIGSLYNNIGYLYDNENLRDSAIYFYRKGIALGKKHNKPNMGCYFNLGYIQRNPDSVYYYTKKALEATIQQKAEHLLTFCYLNLGTNEISRGNYFEADSLLSLSTKNALRFNQQNYLNEIKIQQARLLIQRDKNKEGILLLESVIPYFYKDSQDFDQLTTIYQSLENAYLKEKNFKKAHWALNKYHTNLNEKKNHKKLQKDQGAINFKAIQKSLLKQTQNNQLKQKWYFGIITSLILLLILSIYLFNRYKKFQKEKVAKFAKQNSELNSNVDVLKDEKLQNHQQLLFKNLLVDEKQTFLKHLASEIKELANKPNNKQKKHLLDIYQKIQLNIKDTIGNEFEYHFNEVHPNFYKAFIEKGFELSKNEMRLAALIKLNFNTKEISEITKQTTNTINVAKSRLKNKLELGKNDSLYNFIQKH